MQAVPAAMDQRKDAILLMGRDKKKTWAPVPWWAAKSREFSVMSFARNEQTGILGLAGSLCNE